MNIEAKVIEIINEDGDACATAGNTGGLGNITGTSPSTNIGVTTGSGYASGGGTIGSGDIGLPFQSTGRKNKKKKRGNTKFDKLYQLQQNYTGEKPGKMKKFSEFKNK